MPSVESGATSIHFDETGSGVPIVLGHSFLCSGRMWRHQVGPLAERHRVVNIDFRGHGRSGAATRAFTLYDAVEDVIGVLDHLNIDRAVWCGLSIGGMVAMRAAISHPDRVRALILLDTDAGAESGGRKVRYRVMGAIARLLGWRPLSVPIADLMFGVTTRTQQPALVQEWQRELASLDVPSMLQVLEALLRRDAVYDQLATVRVPALVVAGAEDASLPPSLAERIHERLPDSRFVVISGAGHLSALEQPQPVTRVIMSFLDERVDG